MPFKKVGTLDPHGGPILVTETFGNSVIAVIGRAVETDFGSIIIVNTAGDLIFGHIEGIVTSDGVAPTANGNSGDFTQFYLTTSDNTTLAKPIQGIIDISKFSKYSADPDATLATTYGSNKLGYHIDISTDASNGDYTDESTATATTANYVIVTGTDPADSTNHIVCIYESEVFGV